MALSASEAIDRLYAAPLERFIALRRELAAELRAQGDVDASRDVAAAKKPSRTAWALNQVARREPQRLRGAIDAHATAVEAQSHGDAQTVRETARAFRDAVSEVVKGSADILLAEAGARLNAAHARELSETVRAAIVGDAETRARLLAGRMAEGVESEDPFAGVNEDAAGKKTASGPASKEADRRAAAAREREEQRARDRAIEAARQRVAGLEQEAVRARAAVTQAESAVARAKAEADRARRGVEAVEERLAAARQELEGVSRR